MAGTGAEWLAVPFWWGLVTLETWSDRGLGRTADCLLPGGEWRLQGLEGCKLSEMSVTPLRPVWSGFTGDLRSRSQAKAQTG